MLLAPVARMSRELSTFCGGMSPITEPRGFAPVMTISSSSATSSDGWAAGAVAAGADSVVGAVVGCTGAGAVADGATGAVGCGCAARHVTGNSSAALLRSRERVVILSFASGAT